MRLGRIVLKPDTVLAALGLGGGQIRTASLDEWGNLRLTIEHPTMPDIPENGAIPEVSAQRRRREV